MRIIVVEDELKSLTGITALIVQIKSSYEVVGKARNGKEGAALIKQLLPELVITDITMPEMNGLEMIRELKSKDVSCQYIILSGYADFQFAQEAIKLGSVDYLLKPITQESLEASLERVEEMIRREREKNLLLPSAHTDAELFRQLMSLPAQSSGGFLDELQSRLSGQHFFVLLLIKADTSIVPGDKASVLEIARCRLLAEHVQSIAYPDAPDRNMFLLSFSDRTYPVKEVLTEIQDVCFEKTKLELVFSYQVFDSLHKIDNAREKVIQNSNWNICFAQPVVLGEDMLEAMICQKFIYPADIERAIIGKINAGQMDEIKEDLEQFEKCLHAKVYPYEDIREAMLCLTAAILYAIRKASYGIYEEISHLHVLEWVKRCLFTTAYPTMIMNILRQFKLYRENISRCKNPIISKVLIIIDEEYRTDLSLEGIAERLNITPEYLSTLFSRELGINFTSYLNQYRIESAKRILAAGSHRIYEVAPACGYSDVRYFCKVFKKYTGMPPGEYVRLQHCN